jgi:enoyl-CoA hydratase/carnithine racemase
MAAPAPGSGLDRELGLGRYFLGFAFTKWKNTMSISIALQAQKPPGSKSDVIPNSSDTELPRSLKVERRGDIAIVSLARPEKCNALDTTTVLGLEAFFTSLPEGIKAVVLAGEGKHFCAGLDLGELIERDITDSIAHSRNWHRAFERIESGRVPVVAVLHGAVIGGGLEIAAACHIRVAESWTYYALPEASRGIFVGGGGAVRLPRLIGTARMMDMMLTGRIHEAEEGQAIGISHYLVPPGAGLAKGIEIATRIASNSPISNFAITHALPRIAQSDSASGYLTEALVAAVAQHSDEARARLKAFRDKRAPKTVRT